MHSSNYSELEKQYIKASEAYALGEPIMTDQAFDELERKLRDEGSTLVDYVSEDFLDEGEEREVSYETFSIYSPKTWQEVYEYFSSFPGASFVASLKGDGICTKLGINSSGSSAESRNRNSRNAIDFTRAMQIVLGNRTYTDTINITGEAFVPWEHLEYFREKYDTGKYAMPRSAAISLLRTPDAHDEEDVKLMKFKAFATSVPFNTYAESLDWLADNGYDTFKYEVFKVDLTKNIEEQLEPILASIDTGEPSDGVVFQVNENDVKPSINGKYMSTQIAFKLGKWAGKAYEAEVIGLNFGRAKGNKGVTLQIKPMKLEDGSTINKVNAYNIGIVQRMKIAKGSIIKFERVSNNMCNLVYN